MRITSIQEFVDARCADRMQTFEDPRLGHPSTASWTPKIVFLENFRTGGWNRRVAYGISDAPSFSLAKRWFVRSRTIRRASLTFRFRFFRLVTSLFAPTRIAVGATRHFFHYEKKTEEKNESMRERKQKGRLRDTSFVGREHKCYV